MESSNTEFLKDFVASYDGKPIVFVVTGAGMSVAELTLLPGSSKVVESITIPYGEEAFKRHTTSRVHNGQYPRVSSEVTSSYYYKYANIVSKDTPIVVINGALITNRYRRGKHHAYFIVNNEMYHVTLPKETEEDWNLFNDGEILPLLRAAQDRVVVRLVLSVVQGHTVQFNDTFQKIGEVA